MEKTPDIVRLMTEYNEGLAETVATISLAIAKHMPDPNALIDDLRLISEPDESHTVPMAIFYRRFHMYMSGGEDSTH